MNSILIIAILTSFFCTFLLIPFWMRKAKQIGLVWEDMHRIDKPKNIAGSGGVTILLGFTLGVLLYIAINTFYFKSTENLIEMFALLACIFLVSGIAFIDDLFGWQRKGLSIKSRIILILFAAVPLMVINAGESTMMNIDFGLFYPLLLIPIGVLGATTTFNFLAGYNGLEAGQGILILSALSIVTYLTGNAWLSVVGGFMVASLLAFYIFNKHPAKIFPGDVLTYSVGALIAGMAILGNFEKIAIFVFIPYIIEVILKIRIKLKKQSFCKPQADGSLEMPYEKIYGLTHLSLFILKKFKNKVYEKDVVNLIFVFQIIICLLALVIFKEGIIL